MLIRDAAATDAAAMTALLNAIIALGGTTAHEQAKTVAAVQDDYIDGPDTICCFVAEDAGRIIGFQALGWWQGAAHIGTFVAPDVQARGTGAALFAATRAAARARGVVEIEAAIRADNVPGLAYYARIGFVDIRVEPDFALQDGRVVGRIHRVYPL